MPYSIGVISSNIVGVTTCKTWNMAIGSYVLWDYVLKKCILPQPKFRLHNTVNIYAFEYLETNMSLHKKLTCVYAGSDHTTIIMIACLRDESSLGLDDS